MVTMVASLAALKASLDQESKERRKASDWQAQEMSRIKELLSQLVNGCHTKAKDSSDSEADVQHEALGIQTAPQLQPEVGQSSLAPASLPEALLNGQRPILPRARAPPSQGSRTEKETGCAHSHGASPGGSPMGPSYATATLRHATSSRATPVPDTSPRRQVHFTSEPNLRIQEPLSNASELDQVLPGVPAHTEPKHNSTQQQGRASSDTLAQLHLQQQSRHSVSGRPVVFPRAKTSPSHFPALGHARAVETLRRARSQNLMEIVRLSETSSQHGSIHSEGVPPLSPVEEDLEEAAKPEEGLYCPQSLHHPIMRCRLCLVKVGVAASHGLQCFAGLRPLCRHRQRSKTVVAASWLLPLLAVAAPAMWQVFSGLAFTAGAPPLMAERIQAAGALCALLATWLGANAHREARETLGVLGEKWSFSVEWQERSAASATFCWLAWGVEVFLKWREVQDMELPMLEVVAFGGVCGCMIVAICAVTQTCEGLILLIDGYCSQLCHGDALKDSDMRKDWYVVEACLLEFSEILKFIMLSLGVTYVVAMVSLFAGTVIGLDDQVPLMHKVPCGSFLQLVVCVLALFAHVNLKCGQVGGFANSLATESAIEEGKSRYSSKEELVFLITNSRAGLYLLGALYTGGMTWRLVYGTGTLCYFASRNSIQQFFM